MTRYRTIVADPPWDHSDGTGWDPGDADHRRKPGAVSRGNPRVTGLPYGCMSVDEICALPVSDMAERDAHLYLWTTNRYLRHAYWVAASWKFDVVKPLVWCKEPMGFMGGSFTSSAEFVLFCRRGSLPTQTRAGRQWWVWPRAAHSAKPEAFIDLVEQVSPGPYVELFARRARFGWDYWGDESLGTAELGGFDETRRVHWRNCRFRLGGRFAREDRHSMRSCPATRARLRQSPPAFSFLIWEWQSRCISFLSPPTVLAP